MYFKAKNIFKNNKQIQGFWYILFLKNIICEKAPSRHFFLLLLLMLRVFFSLLVKRSSWGGKEILGIWQKEIWFYWASLWSNKSAFSKLQVIIYPQSWKCECRYCPLNCGRKETINYRDSLDFKGHNEGLCM
jgi:hypothetical protein